MKKTEEKAIQRASEERTYGSPNKILHDICSHEGIISQKQVEEAKEGNTEDIREQTGNSSKSEFKGTRRGKNQHHNISQQSQGVITRRAATKSNET